MYSTLLELLKETGYSFEEVAKVLGVTRQALYNKIYKKTKFKIDEMIVLQNLINGTLKKKYTLEKIFDTIPEKPKKV